MMYRVSFENHFLFNETYFLSLTDDFTSIRMLESLEIGMALVCCVCDELRGKRLSHTYNG